MLVIQNLKKYFGENKAVDDISFTINAGEIFCLIGPNSAGKSTLIKSIVGLLEPTSGTITVHGEDVVRNPEGAKQYIGYIPDEPSIWSHMTGEEFLYFTQALYGVRSEEKENNKKNLLPIFSLEGIEKSNFEDYSRGNKQKFSILAALSHKPKLLLVDEPIVGLDPLGAETAKKLFVEFAKNGGAILLVTHTLPVAEEIATKIGFIKNGTLATSGTLQELRERAGLPSTASLEDVYKKLAS